MEKFLKLNETDANFLHTALRRAIKSRHWDPMDEEQAMELKSYIDLFDRVSKYLDG